MTRTPPPPYTPRPLLIDDLLDGLLEQPLVRTGTPAAFDVAAALRRLSTDAATAPARPGDNDLDRATKATARLNAVCRAAITTPAAALHIERISDSPPTPPDKNSPHPEAPPDVEGLFIYGCLLHLADHPESAKFWWQIAAGSEHGVAAHCLHLHHLTLGEIRDAAHWAHQLTEADKDAVHRLLTAPLIPATPTSGLEMAIERIAETGDDDVIVGQPDRALAHHLRQLTHP
ncbi:hypothetical protein [Streptomyces sp. SPB074]|uniref:hypothetical protein n=1 Tax=Streptomyces sp. (strain SPB074) TaxID=465543 RepID=UPI00017F2211|nr:hypothetical protein [Streptomyces sp. SPB074]EDY43110.2 conserved hypothetical protein [Streptomyces sp. SPB074]